MEMTRPEVYLIHLCGDLLLQQALYIVEKVPSEIYKVCSYGGDAEKKRQGRAKEGTQAGRRVGREEREGERRDGGKRNG